MELCHHKVPEPTWIGFNTPVSSLKWKKEDAGVPECAQISTSCSDLTQTNSWILWCYQNRPPSGHVFLTTNETSSWIPLLYSSVLLPASASIEHVVFFPQALIIATSVRAQGEQTIMMKYSTYEVHFQESAPSGWEQSFAEVHLSETFIALIIIFIRPATLWGLKGLHAPQSLSPLEAHLWFAIVGSVIMLTFIRLSRLSWSNRVEGMEVSQRKHLRFQPRAFAASYDSNQSVSSLWNNYISVLSVFTSRWPTCCKQMFWLQRLIKSLLFTLVSCLKKTKTKTNTEQQFV